MCLFDIPPLSEGSDISVLTSRVCRGRATAPTVPPLRVRVRVGAAGVTRMCLERLVRGGAGGSRTRRGGGHRAWEKEGVGGGEMGPEAR